MAWEVFKGPSRGRKRSFDHDQAVRLFLAGRSPAAVAHELGVSAHAVRLMLWRKGFDLVRVRRSFG